MLLSVSLLQSLSYFVTFAIAVHIPSSVSLDLPMYTTTSDPTHRINLL